MKNKSLIIVSIILAILFISTISFANNDIKNGIHNATDTAVDGVSNLANDVRSGIGTAEDAVENGVKNVGNAITDGAQDLGNNLSDDMNKAGRAVTDNDGYTTTRTTADVTNTNTMNSSLWTWIILAVAAMVIVGLVWYYASQNNNGEH